jgi:5'-methylthioinosine phosphorylase
MSVIGLIGGSGAELYRNTADAELLHAETDWGSPSAPLQKWQQHGHEVYFLARHGQDGVIPPHRVNYRANIQALADAGAEYVVAMNAVGGISAAAKPGALVIPEQLIDYTSGRCHTYYDTIDSGVKFVEFTEPYDTKLRKLLIDAAHTIKLPVVAEGVYGVTQGPRLETAAEIDRLERDGCSIVGMTSMPEAALARELGLPYVSCCSVVNYAAGRSAAAIHAEIASFLQLGIGHTAQLIDQFLQDIS